MISLILLNGQLPSLELLQTYWALADYRVCADGAANYVFESGFTPDIILGDFDSYIPSEKNQHSICLHINDQSRTDGEKAIEHCIQKGSQAIYLLGATGGLVDHELYNLSLLYYFHHFQIPISLFTENSELFLINQNITLKKHVGCRISFFAPFDVVTGFTTYGLRYNLINQDLAFGRVSSISNVFAEDNASINLNSGVLLAIIERT